MASFDSEYLIGYYQRIVRNTERLKLNGDRFQLLSKRVVMFPLAIRRGAPLHGSGLRGIGFNQSKI